MRALGSTMSGCEPTAKDWVNLIKTLIPPVPQALGQLRDTGTFFLP